MAGKNDRPWRAPFEPYLEQLRELPFVKDVELRHPPKSTPDTGLDAVAHIETPSGRKRLSVEVKRGHLTKETARRLRAIHGKPEHWILFAPYITTPVGEELEHAGLNFIDEQGNCSIRLGKNYVARVLGHSAPKVPAQAKSIRAAGYQVLFALLAEPDLMDASLRAIGQAAGASRQAVSDMLDRLVERRWVVKRDGGHVWVDSGRREAFEQWLAGYHATVRPKLFLGQFRVQGDTPAEVERLVEKRLEDFRYGGAAAAHRMGGLYRGNTTVVHVPGPVEPARKQLRAVRSEHEANVILLHPIGEVSWRGERGDTVHPLLVYSELETDPSPRARDAAHEFRERWLPWSL